MNVVILTSSNKGSAPIHLIKLVESKKINVKSVIISQGKIKNRIKYYRKKIIKVFKIGLFGALNGLRMRKWYIDDVENLMNLQSIENLCKKHHIPFNFTPTINCIQTEMYIKNTNADLGLSLGNDYISSKIYLIPKLGMVNIHHEELPAYQNAQSIIWQLYNNSPNTGFTIHKVDKNIDTGDILFKDTIPIIFKKNLRETVYFTCAKLWEKSAVGLVILLENFEFYSKKSFEQKNGSTYTTPSLKQYITIIKNFKSLKRLYKLEN